MVAEAIKVVAGQAFPEDHEAEVEKARGQTDPDRDQKNRRWRGARRLRHPALLRATRRQRLPVAILWMRIHRKAHEAEQLPSIMANTLYRGRIASRANRE